MIIALNIFVGICIFIIGALFGSFFSLAFHRIPKHEDIVIKNSYCPKCLHKLSFFDLIPIISFLSRGGKCKYCKEKISIKYLLLELLNGTVFLFLYILLGYNLRLLVVILIYVILFFIIGTIISNHHVSRIKRNHGVFLTELIVAIILFSMILTSMYIVVRNNINKNIITVARANALDIAIKNIEISKLTDYDKLESFTTSEMVDNVVYNVNVKVSKLSDEDRSKQDIVKKITVVISYNVDGKDYDLSINTVKGKVL
ncbi:MAG: prepilin peptidase [Clostridia bacterium]|nr:prepilin peptidase [Clostridia bacterium]